MASARSVDERMCRDVVLGESVAEGGGDGFCGRGGDYMGGRGKWLWVGSDGKLLLWRWGQVYISRVETFRRGGVLRQ